MIANNKSRKFYAVLLATITALVLMFSMTVPAFATETESATESVTEKGTESATEKETGTGTEAESTTEKTTEKTTSTTTDTTHDHDHDHDEEGTDLTAWIINLVVAGVVVIAIVALCIAFRKKIPGWWKALKSECKKIVWCPKDKLRKNTIVVIIVIVAITLVIALLDFAFSGGLKLLRDLFQ